MTQSTPAPTEIILAPCAKPLLYRADNLSLYHAQEGPNRGASHDHEDMQIALPISGPLHMAWQTAGGRRRQQTVPPGTPCLSASRQPHAVGLGQETELAVVWLPAPFLARTAEELGTPGPVEIAHCGETQDALLQQLCLALLAEVRQARTPVRLYVDAMANLVAARLVRQHSAQGGAAAEITGGLSPRRLRLVRAYVQEHLERDIALADLAEVAGLSPSHFGPLFRRSVGTTPYQYVLARRIERAKSLLRAGRLSVGEVALQVGFCDQSQFTRQFKRQVGLTPRAFVKAVL